MTMSKHGANFYQMLVFSSLYAGYTLNAYIRKSFTFALPGVINSEGLLRSQLGLVTSSQTIAYSISKFISGFLADRYNAKFLFQASLLLTGISAVLFTGFSSIWMFAFWWFINGLCQGPSWPACAKMLMAWFPPENFGTWWSILSTSMNVAGSLGPLITTFLTIHYGWRIGMLLPGLSCILLVLIFGVSIYERPSSLGLPDYLDVHSDKKSDQNAGKGMTDSTKVYSILLDPFLLLLGMNYMVLFVIRTCVFDWGQLYLIHEKQLSTMTSSILTSSMEVGGIVGSLSAGYLSDKAHSMQQQQNGTCRLNVARDFCFGVIIFLFSFIFYINKDSYQIWIIIVGCGLGFCLYGPLAVFGVVAMESVPQYLCGTAHSVVSVFANVGAVLSGFPATYMASYLSWRSMFVFLNFLSIATMVSLWHSARMKCLIGTEQNKQRTS